MNIQCVCCLGIVPVPNFWSLTDYYGLSGNFCITCYTKVKHDDVGKPKHPQQYKKIVEMMDARKVMKKL